MKYLVIGDPHVTPKNLELMTELTNWVETKGLPVIWLGDMLDTKEIIRGSCLDFWHNYFSSSKLPHYVLVGNHDLYNLHSKDHSLNTLKMLPNVQVVDEPQTIAGTNVNLIPYIHDRKELMEAISKFEPGTTLFGHLEISGFDFGNGHICQNELDSAKFSKFKTVISGHFHKYQKVGNLTYLGTPFSHSFGESDQTKYIGLYDGLTQELELIESFLPQHRTHKIEIKDSDTTAAVTKQVKEIFKEEASNYLRIDLHGHAEDLKRIKVSEIKKKYPNIKFKMSPKKLEMTQVEISDGASNETQFVTWAMQIKGLKKEELELGLQLLEEASK